MNLERRYSSSIYIYIQLMVFMSSIEVNLKKTGCGGVLGSTWKSPTFMENGYWIEMMSITKIS